MIAIRWGLTLAAVFLASTAAFSHEWYPPNCCHGDDCRRTRAEFHPDEGYWYFKVEETGKWAPVPLSQVRPTPVPPDHMCHVCYRYDKDSDATHVYCFFPCGAGG